MRLMPAGSERFDVEGISGSSSNGEETGTARCRETLGVVRTAAERTRPATCSDRATREHVHLETENRLALRKLDVQHLFTLGTAQL